MDTQNPSARDLIEVSAADGVETGSVEVITAGRLEPNQPVICAAHPADDFTDTAALLHEVTGCAVVCVNVRGVGRSSAAVAAPAQAIAAMTDDLEAVRRRLGLGPWTFWGMSGGGWIGQQYAQRHPAGLAALILESVCPCFRERLADPACVLSPFFPAWRPALEQAGLIAADSHAQAGDPADTGWTDLPGVGAVFRRLGGPALLVSPMALAPAMRAVMPALWLFDARPWLGAVRLPTLVLAGDADPVVPLAHARALQQAIPGARLAIIEGASHVPTGQRHPAVRAAVGDFLR